MLGTPASGNWCGSGSNKKESRARVNCGFSCAKLYTLNLFGLVELRLQPPDTYCASHVWKYFSGMRGKFAIFKSRVANFIATIITRAVIIARDHTCARNFLSDTGFHACECFVVSSGFLTYSLPSRSRDFIAIITKSRTAFIACIEIKTRRRISWSSLIRRSATFHRKISCESAFVACRTRIL